MKKYLKSLLLLIISVVLSLTFASCGNPIDKLNSKEKLIYEALIYNRDNWYEPGEIEIIGVHKKLFLDTDGFIEDYECSDEDNFCKHAFLKIKFTPVSNVPKLDKLKGTDYTGYFDLQVTQGKSTEKFFRYGDINPCEDNEFFSHSPSSSIISGAKKHTYTTDESKISAKKIQAALEQYWEDEGLK